MTRSSPDWISPEVGRPASTTHVLPVVEQVVEGVAVRYADELVTGGPPGTGGGRLRGDACFGVTSDADTIT